MRGAVRTYSGSGGKAIFIGHCLAADHQVRAAVATGNPAVIARLPGSYSFVFGTAESNLLLAVDTAGQFPIYFAERAGQIVFSSHAVLLASLVGSDIDRVALAADVIFLPGTRTVFCDIDQVASGMALRVDKNGSSYIRMLRPEPDERTTLDDAAERLRTRLVEAVEARAVASSLSADFSGGLDSTSLAHLALDARGTLPVLTFRSSVVPVPDDFERAARWAAMRPGFRHVLVDGGQDQLPYQNLVAAVDQPQWAPITMAPLRLRLETAARLGSDLHLVGEAGDLLLGAPQIYLADLARRGELAMLWRHCLCWARLRGRSPAALFRRALLLAAKTRRTSLHGLARMLVTANVPRSNPAWEQQVLSHWGQLSCDFLLPAARRSLAAQIMSMAEAQSDRLDLGDQATTDLLRLVARAQRALRDAVTDLPVALHAPSWTARSLKRA
ncbi:lasso peptide isopeptide bond-forming cyclase [Kibdelosporangium lantanae]